MNAINKLIIILVISLSSFNVAAKAYQYNADVEGMVCAFCAYSVGKNISKLSGVDEKSVNVNLKGGHVVFNSQKKISEKKLMNIFNDSGFKLSNIRYTEIENKSSTTDSEIVLDLKIDAFKTDQFSPLIEAIGNKVANTKSRLVITAPASQEETILKPLLMGRQQVVKVKFIAADIDMINIQLFNQ